MEVKNNSNKYICCIGAKSGGHIIPAIFYGKNYVDDHNAKLILFSSSNKLDRDIIARYNFIFKNFTLNVINFPGKKILKYPKFLLQVVFAIFKSLFLLIKYRPIKIVNFGSYISIPVCLAAWLLRIPIELFELNSTPGKAMKFLVPFASKIKICFKKAKNYFPINKVIYESYPIRFKESDKISKNQACKAINFNPDYPVLLILGGSQGSEFINNFAKKLVLNNLKYLPNLQVVHQSGVNYTNDLNEFYKMHNIRARVVSFIQDLNVYYSAADFVVSRAGAGTLFELLFFKKKTIVVPLLSSITEHQADNAKVLAAEHPDLFNVYDQNSLYNLLLTNNVPLLTNI